ncbi:MAG: DMT family transporter [Rhodobacter sp.]|uniref:DMT family transporter n=1 Tax=Pararhodobacter sp. TaxID=2127056 RepID=UPI001DB11C04|nr:DMT family transporter [Pararhodobacter sp.]MCB1344521.1 DMT family transporter [Paracoccaceae bacterium]MCC0074940.1 DMT family transporter [Rhodobacter sp.]HPD91355.1 DMT family transporter [Pararhodobacter sp.]
MNRLQGPLMMVLSMGGFALQDALIKTLAQRIPAGEISLTIGFGGALVFGLMLRRRRLPLVSRQAVRGAVLVRNLAEVFAATCMILGVALVPLSVVSSILQAMPLTVTLGAAVFLGEPVGWRRWSAIVVGLVGVLMILRPGAGGFDQLALIPLAAVFVLSARDIATRKVPPGVASLQLSFWGFLALFPSGLLLLALRGEGLVAPDALEWLMLLGATVFGVLAYAALVMATRTGSIAATTPFRYARLVFAMLLGVLVFGERPDGWMLAGAALVVLAGLYTLMREIAVKRR